MVRPFVLCYHQIDPTEFEKQISYLKERFEILDLDAFLGCLRHKGRGPFCTLTLDDCLKKDAERATLLCKKHRIPITFFLPVRFSIRNEVLPGTKVQRLLQERDMIWLQGRHLNLNDGRREKITREVFAYFNPAKFRTDEFDAKVKGWYDENEVSEKDILTEADRVLTIDKVEKLSKEPLFNFQSHTYSHDSLGLCSDDEIEFELARSKITLESVTKKEVNAVCYPYGSPDVVGSRVLKLVDKYYDSGFTLVQGACTRRTNRYAVPRIGIYPSETLMVFCGKIYHYMQTAYFN